MQQSVASPARSGWLWRAVTAVAGIYIAVVLALMWWWDYEPPHFDVAAAAQGRMAGKQQKTVTGAVTVSALRTTAETLLDKRGG